jgi:hypothetical protein
MLELAQIRAIHAAIEPSSESIWRMRCRDYSERFHTPLHVVMSELEPLFVMQQLYEAQYPPKIVDEELTELLETLNKIKDPNYSTISAEEMEDLVDAVMNKELRRLSKKKRPTQEVIGHTAKVADTTQTKPKSGSMKFDDLEKIDSRSESGKSGFDNQ